MIVFLAINYFMQSCVNKEEDITVKDGNLLVTTTDTEYSRTKLVTVEIENNTEETITLKNQCPGEPFDVFRYENNEWIQKEVSPELDCSKAEDITLNSGDKTLVAYENWNFALFSQMGRFKIELTTKIGEEEKTISTNEFEVVREGLFKQIWNGIFYKPIYNALIWLTAVLPGHYLWIAIILLTIIIRTILLVPSQKAMKAQKRMQEIQPRLEKIKQKYKGDQAKIAQETMALWKESKASPMGSCLPMLLQIPFLIALFYAVQRGLNPDNVYLLYSSYGNFALHDINVSFFGLLDLTQKNLYVLPLIVGGLQFTQMKLSMMRNAKKKDEKGGKKDKASDMQAATNMMTYIMPIMIAVFTASLPAGVGFYWGTSTLYGIIQQIFVNKSGGKDKDEPTVRVIKSNS